MWRRLLVVLSAAGFSACGAAQLCPQRHGMVHQPAMSCAELNSVTAAAVKRLGFNINNFAPATSEQVGKLEGTKRDDYDNTYHITVELKCSASEAMADAVTTLGCGGQISFPNDFQQSFVASIGKKTGPTLVPKDEQAGLRIEVEPQRDGDKAVGVPLAAVDLMVVKVTINNRTSRTYRVDNDAVTLVSQAGTTVDDIPPAEAAKRVAQKVPAEGANAQKRLSDKSLQAGTIDANGKLEGYLYVPRQAYKRATVRLVDTEADEPEGFTVEF